MSAITREGAGAPLVARARTEPPWTLLAMCGRDRAALVYPAIESVRAAWPGWTLLFHRDPLDRELDPARLRAAGVSALYEIALPAELPPRRRVAAMRSAAAARACELGYQRVLFVDSDVLVDPGAGAELERLWALRPSPSAAVALTRCSVYDSAEYACSIALPASAAIRTVGLGMALAFPCGAALERAARTPVRGSWDSRWCHTVAGGVVVTPEQSWAIHEGRASGICLQHHPGLDVINPTPRLAARWSDGQASLRGEFRPHCSDAP